MIKKTHLFVVAHPDDEILGCYATIAKFLRRGDKVVVVTMCGVAATRENEIQQKEKNIHKLIGVTKSVFFDYEAMKFATYDRYKMTKDIENVILSENPDYIYTHDINDIHNDHRVLSQVTLEASKLPLRGIAKINGIKGLYLFEVPSSTDWGAGFIPNAYVKVGKEDVQKKAELLMSYDDVIRSVPHPRNEESFLALARYRGGQCGCDYAEAYRKIFEVTE